MPVMAKENKKESLKIMLKEDNLGLTQESEWDALVEHIEVHKYLVNQRISWTISWKDAVFSWYENVYRPVLQAIESWEIKRAFPDMNRGQLFFAVCSHWYYMQEKNPNVPAQEAAVDFAAQYGHGLAKWFSRFLVPRAA